jgi:hypothetical protein
VNQARKAFERFEKSDSWLPVILFSVFGAAATIACVVATQHLQLSSKSSDQKLFLIGELIGRPLVTEPTLFKRVSNPLPDLALQRFGKVEEWGNDFRFIEGYAWNPAWSRVPVSKEDEVSEKTYCWLSEDNLRLLVLSTANGEEKSGKRLGELLSFAAIISVERGTERQFETTSVSFLPAAPWESLVSVESTSSLESAKLFEAHAKHVAGKELVPLRESELLSFLQKAVSRKAHWLIDRGGLNFAEAVSTSDALPLVRTLLGSFERRVVFSLGVRNGMAAQATALALAAYSKVAQVEDAFDFVVLHNCPSAIELEMQMNKSLARRAALMDNRIPSALIPPSQLAKMVDDATKNGIQLQSRVDELIAKLESDQYATKVYELTEPVAAKIYRLKALSNE